MLTPPLLDGLSAAMVETPRLKTHVIIRGPEDGIPVLLIHGNASAARFYEELMVALPPRYRVIAPDLRGYGRSERKPIDATRGVRDFSDDLKSLADTLGLGRFHLMGWSLGGNAVRQYAIDYPADLLSLTLMASGSPFGFGATYGPDGTPTNPEYSGSGGGAANPDLVKRLAEGDRSSESPTSPRNVMNSLYYKPPFRATAEREEVFLGEMLLIGTGPDFYPGDGVPAQAWPGIGPGTRGTNNTLSPKYLNQSDFATIDPKPPVLWIRGDSDVLVSDQSTLDFAVLGQLGVVPGYPGPEVYPSQPMILQQRTLLERYRDNGGTYEEVVLQDCGHSPHIEKPAEFLEAFSAFLDRNSQ